MKLNIFSKEEERYYHAFQKFRDHLLMPLCKILASWKVKPEYVSFLGFFMIVPFVLFFPTNPWLSAIALFINVLLDCLDGPLARYTHTVTARGALIDLSCDYGSFCVVFVTLLVYRLTTAYWALFYILMYGLMLYQVTYCRKKNIHFFPVIRSKYYLYLVLLLLIATGVNWFDAFFVLFGVYMMVTNIFLFDRIRCSSKS